MEKSVVSICLVMAVGLAGCGQSAFPEMEGITPAEIEAREAAEAQEVYEYMSNEFKAIVDSGEEYNPEVHDRKVLEKTAEHFHISVEKIDPIIVQRARSTVQK